MSKYNSTKVTSPTETNFMGEKAYQLSDKEALTTLVMTTFLADSYYMKENEIVSNIKKLVDNVGYEYAAKLAIYARTKGNMRSVSHLLASLVCKDSTHPTWLKSFYNNIVVRPDDMTEILCCYAALNKIDITKPIRKLPNAMKKGFRKALEKLSPYQIDKYKMNSKNVSLVDLVNIFHPTPTDKNAEAYRRLMHGESLDGTYNAKIFEKEMSASCQDEDMSDDDKNLAKHDAIVEVLKSGMPIMNLLRNIRNIMKYAPDMVDEAIKQLTNHDKIIHSKLLPFRFSSAYDAVKVIEFKPVDTEHDIIVFESELMTKYTFEQNKTKMLKALEDAMTISCENVPKLNGNCAILIDHSGSVRGDWYNSSTISPFSSVRTAMIGNLFGSIMAYKQDNVYVGMFGDKLIPVKMDRDVGMLEFCSRSYAEGKYCGGATENGLYMFLKSAIDSKKKIDNLIIFSDMEIGDGSTRAGWDCTSSYHVPFFELFKQFKKINHNCTTVCCNINGRSGTTVFNPKMNLINIAGWSNSIFDTIALYANKQIKSITEEIDKIQLM